MGASSRQTYDPMSHFRLLLRSRELHLLDHRFSNQKPNPPAPFPYREGGALLPAPNPQRQSRPRAGNPPGAYAPPWGPVSSPR
jgi:hypothetical protein